MALFLLLKIVRLQQEVPEISQECQLINIIEKAI